MGQTKIKRLRSFLSYTFQREKPLDEVANLSAKSEVWKAAVLSTAMSSVMEQQPLEALADLLRGRRTVALTGAGISTESGIPDYRGEGTRRRAKSPIQYRQFVEEGAMRQRYWARSLAGWPRVAAAEPNAGHLALARLEEAGCLQGVITQNVDRLHHQAGSGRVVELHGALAEVICLGCEHVSAREGLQKRLLRINPSWKEQAVQLRPDGDAELSGKSEQTFRVPACLRCGGALKPNVVFFGESVPKKRVEAAWQLFEEAEVLLVLGSSLTVYSGYRFVLRAAREDVPVAIVNLGPTRGDDRAALLLNSVLGKALPLLSHALIDGRS